MPAVASPASRPLLATILVLGAASGALAATPPPIPPAPRVTVFVGVAPCDGGSRGKACEPLRLETDQRFDESFPEGKACVGDKADCDAARNLRLAVRGFFHNGGPALWVVPFPRVPAAGEVDEALRKLAHARDVAFLAAPGLTDPALQTLLVHHAEATGAFAVLDGPADPRVDAAAVVGALPPSAAAALYHPWLSVREPLTRRAVPTPPSGHVTGLLASLDATRRFSPAGRTLSGVEGLVAPVGVDRVSQLRAARVDVPPIVALARATGTPVTLSTALESRYVALTLLRNHLRRSITAGTAWAATAANDQATWSALVGQVDSFLYDAWRLGTLMGSKPAEAWFVRCDRTTMTQADLDAGRTVLLYGFAPLKPAEFVVDQLVIAR